MASFRRALNKDRFNASYMPLGGVRVQRIGRKIP